MCVCVFVSLKERTEEHVYVCNTQLSGGKWLIIACCYSLFFIFEISTSNAEGLKQPRP